jgi:putative transposase
MNLTYTYKLRLNKAQQARIEGWIGVCRLVWNMALEIKQDAYKKGIPLSFYDLEKQLTGLKDIPWIADVPSSSLSGVVQNLKMAYDKFFKHGGFPKFKSKRDKNSVRIRQDKRHKPIRFESGNRVRIPKLGVVKIFTDRLPDGEILLATIHKKADGYYLNISVEIEKRPLPVSENQVGVDVGLSLFCVLSDGSMVEHPQLLKASSRRLRVEQRRLSRMKKGGSNRKKQVKKVAGIYLKVSRQRQDFLQKLSTHLIRSNQSVFVENLNIRGMVRSTLAGKINDSSWGCFRQMLTYKSALYGRQFAAVPAKHTSQECSNCTYTSPGNRKTQSEFKCQQCRHEANADHNAAINILRRGQRLLSQSTDTSLRLGKEPENSGCQQFLNETWKGKDITTTNNNNDE